jgi:hypothetical protein
LFVVPIEATLLFAIVGVALCQKMILMTSKTETEQKILSLHSYTGCRSQIRKIFEFKIWKKRMLALKQTIHQQKALDLSFNMAT